MRLLNVKTMKIVEFVDKRKPQYAILSHTWGENEITFRMFDRDPEAKWRSLKINGCCEQARADSLEYVWIDTCCIDKSSSAELSEAINSMFKWYQRAVVCYVYLADVEPHAFEDSRTHSPLNMSRWFTRGWTLQELLAPPCLQFYDCSRTLRGQIFKERHQYYTLRAPAAAPSIGSSIAEITRISEAYIRGEHPLNMASIAMRMSWASERETTRTEDLAYCLLGLFDVAMPMLYGEGTKAFRRLQEEIMKNEDDQSIFAWGYRADILQHGVAGPGAVSYLATMPSEFEFCRQIRRISVGSRHYTITNKGLHIAMAVRKLITGDYVGQLNCSDLHAKEQSYPGSTIVVPLIRHDDNNNTFYRPAALIPEPLPEDFFHAVDLQHIYISGCIPTLLPSKQFYIPANK